MHLSTDWLESIYLRDIEKKRYTNFTEPGVDHSPLLREIDDMFDKLEAQEKYTILSLVFFRLPNFLMLTAIGFATYLYYQLHKYKFKERFE